ncbi:hypothetical protein N7497_002997 [Penicillium chrysogenum]|nr:hypothetical protein N7497_002997 [Penicillium chrysogenum]
MFRNTALKATNSGMLRGATSSSSRRSFHLATSARSASKSSGFSMTARRPLAVVDRAFNGARSYAAPAEGPSQGVDPNDSFLTGSTANYIDEMYMAWKNDASSVHISWQTYFKNMEEDMPGQGLAAGADVTNHLKVQLLCRAYQARGHHKAKIDPLGIRGEAEAFGYDKPKELELDHYGFTERDLDQEFALGPGILPRFITESRKKMTLREIIAACEKIYCGSYGVEYIHIPDRKPCEWIRDRFEIPQPYNYSVDDKRRILDRLIWSSSFESFLATKFPNDKRFGLEGCETFSPWYEGPDRS